MSANYHQEANEKSMFTVVFCHLWKQTVIANNYIKVRMLIGSKLRDVEAPNKDQSQKATSSL
jgi:hypothetical protein